MKRKIKYIIVTILISYMLTVIGINAAYTERGYKAVGGEMLIPAHICIVASAIYNRREIKALLTTADETEEKEGGD